MVIERNENPLEIRQSPSAALLTARGKCEGPYAMLNFLSMSEVRVLASWVKRKKEGFYTETQTFK